VRPNLPVLGPKYGPRVGQIQKALGAADKASIATAVASRQQVHVDGFTLEPDELLVSASGKPGFATAEEAGYAAAVTTEITPELADEGLARELVRRVQEMRKSAGFEIADRIRLYHTGDSTLERVLTTWGDYVAQEVLAEAIAEGSLPEAAYREEHDLEGTPVVIAVERV
jgi:isoleucyl-tRNA synthetase